MIEIILYICIDTHVNDNGTISWEKSLFSIEKIVFRDNFDDFTVKDIIKMDFENDFFDQKQPFSELWQRAIFTEAFFREFLGKKASSVVTTVYNVEISHLLVEWQTRVLSAHLSGTPRESYFSILAFDQNNLL